MTKVTELKAPKVPCGSCPYRKDVPSGIWASNEYEKLPEYDGETWEQSPIIFMCHQNDGKLCGGWLACHDPQQLLALRMPSVVVKIDPAVFDYKTDVPVFSSGQEACDHGMKDIDNKSPEADKMILGLVKKKYKRGKMPAHDVIDALREENEKLKAQIDEAHTCASETAPDMRTQLIRVMGALGFDYGDESTEPSIEVPRSLLELIAHSFRTSESEYDRTVMLKSVIDLLNKG